MKSSKIVSHYIGQSLQREEVVRRTVAEGTELCMRPLIYLCAMLAGVKISHKVREDIPQPSMGDRSEGSACPS